MSDRWIFVRLFNYKANNPVFKVLSGFISKVNPVEGITYNHAQINTMLNDDYLALKTPHMCRETSRDMKYAVRGKTQTDIYGILCNDEEYSKIRINLAQAEQNSDKVWYNIWSMPSFIFDQLNKKSEGLYNKDTNNTESSSANDELMQIINSSHIENYKEDKGVDKNSYVCSSFVAYILADAIPEIREHLEKNKMDKFLISPSEIAMFPRLQLLYRCDIGNVDQATQEFIKANPSFKQYFDYNKQYSLLMNRLDHIITI